MTFTNLFFLVHCSTLAYAAVKILKQIFVKKFVIKNFQIDEIVLHTIKASLEKCDHQDLILQQSFLNQIIQLPIKFTVTGIFIIDRTFIANVIFFQRKFELSATKQ